ncbi:hypothetical protein FRC12_013742 [Ceratobasidium sp. 428]|nr:hypothetical protein FRC12_013742 [Ceratobasidium sp. 428]
MNSSFSAGFDDQQVGILATIADNRVALGATAALGAAFVWYLATSSDKQIKTVRGWPLVGQWEFFTRRYDFLLSNFQRLPSSSTMFRFSILEHNLVAMRGEDARKNFFDRRELSFNDGYSILLGGVPVIKDLNVDDGSNKSDKEKGSDFLRCLTRLLRVERMRLVTPQIMADIEHTVAKWGTRGQFNPFSDLYSLVVQLTIRTVGCREIADSTDLCKKMEKLYLQVEQGSTAASLLLPWFPSQARKRKTAATADIYVWLDNIIKARQKENRREEDALQDLIDSEGTTPTIVQTIMGSFFAGITNTGLMAAWLLIFLDQVPEWREKVIEELQALLKKHAPLSDMYSSPAERFSAVPFEAWENEMPVFENCLRETIRLAFTLSALRRVTQGDLELGGERIRNGTFFVYPLSDTHQNPDIYPEPSKFNPGRFAEGQDKSQNHGFLGWGVGRHPCAGRRFAQFEIKAMLCMFLSSYDYQVINSKGVRPDPSTTVPDRNDSIQPRPKDEVFYVKYIKRDQPI